MWYVYILQCKNNTLYTGVTNDLERRFKGHLNKNTHYTSYNPPVGIVYKEEHSTKSLALKREFEIKSWPRKKKLVLIQNNPFFV